MTGELGRSGESELDLGQRILELGLLEQCLLGRGLVGKRLVVGGVLGQCLVVDVHDHHRVVEHRQLGRSLLAQLTSHRRRLAPCAGSAGGSAPDPGCTTRSLSTRLMR